MNENQKYVIKLFALIGQKQHKIFAELEKERKDFKKKKDRVLK